jgi:hypothetical protein
LQTKFNSTSKKIILHNEVDFIPGIQHIQINKCNIVYKQNQEQRSHDHLNWGSFYDKSSEKLRMKEKYLNIVKGIYDKPIANITLNVGKLKPLPLN